MFKVLKDIFLFKNKAMSEWDLKFRNTDFEKGNNASFASILALEEYSSN